MICLEIFLLPLCKLLSILQLLIEHYVSFKSIILSQRSFSILQLGCREFNLQPVFSTDCYTAFCFVNFSFYSVFQASYSQLHLFGQVVPFTFRPDRAYCTNGFGMDKVLMIKCFYGVAAVRALLDLIKWSSSIVRSNQNKSLTQFNKSNNESAELQLFV